METIKLLRYKRNGFPKKKKKNSESIKGAVFEFVIDHVHHVNIVIDEFLVDMWYDDFIKLYEYAVEHAKAMFEIRSRKNNYLD